jgi:4-hydroxy-tetrahydrodipicolinate synthase
VGWQALRRLAELPGIAGVKHAVGGIDEDTVRLLADLPDGFAVLAGDDAFASPLLALGAAGAILASANVCTGSFAAMVRAWQDGECARARTLGQRLAGLSAALFAEPNPVVIKAVLHAQGRIPSPSVRLPLLAAGPGATATALREVTHVTANARSRPAVIAP